MRPGQAARGRTPTRVPDRWRTSRMARPCSSSSVGGRRSGSCSARRRGVAGTDEADRRAGPRRWAAAAAADAARSRAGSPSTTSRRRRSSIRAMLPPGLLERLELVAERTPRRSECDAGSTIPVDRRSARAARQRARGRPGSSPPPDGPGRAAAPPARRWPTRDVITLDWTLLGAGAGPRYERWVALTRAGREAAALRSRGATPGRPLGPRQVAALGRARRRCRPGRPRRGRRRAARDRGRRRARPARAWSRPMSASGRGGRWPRDRRACAAAGRPSADLARAGRGRRPRAPSDRRARPPTAPPRRRDRRWQDRDLRRGDRGLARGRAAGARARPGDRAGDAAGRSAAGRPRRPGRARPLGARRWRARGRVAAYPRRAMWTSWSGRGWPSSHRWPTSGSSSSTRSTTPPTRATGRRASRRATRRSGSATLAGAAIVLGSATPAVESLGRALDRSIRPGRPADPARRAPRRSSRSSDLRAELAAGNRGLLSRALDDALAALDTTGGRAGHPRPEPAGDGIGRALPRLRPRPGLPGLRAAARVPPGGHDPALPPLRPRDATRHPLSDTAAHRGSAISAAAQSGSSARCARHIPAARRSARPGCRRAARRRGAGRSTRSRRADVDVLVGTSLVTKGLDMPTVTLVGVVSSDVALNLPDERAAERTYQLLAPGGRAGRPRRPAGPRDRPDLPARPPGHPRRRAGRRRYVLRRRSSTCVGGSVRRRSGGSSS